MNYRFLLLWDIDGTLVLTDGAGERALTAAMSECFGLSADMAEIPWAGRTDRRIARMLFERHGITCDATNVSRFLASYVRHLPRELPLGDARILPGIREILESVEGSEEWQQGLLTGNLRGGAKEKLAYLGIWDFFGFGAFADDSEDRDGLGPFALERAEAFLGRRPSPSEVWVIGDTVHDVACGKAIGANTVAVSTGFSDPELLRVAGADLFFEDLGDPEGFFHRLRQFSGINPA